MRVLLQELNKGLRGQYARIRRVARVLRGQYVRVLRGQRVTKGLYIRRHRNGFQTIRQGDRDCQRA